jgi:predicted metal-dependent peptidase
MQKARAAIILSYPFYASLLCSLKIEENSSIKTMATDGESIQFNPKFVESLDQGELIFIICHEIMHCVFLHSFRAQGKNHETWNHATDYIINDLLETEKVGKRPSMGLFNKNLCAQANYSAEKLYTILENQSPQEKQKRCLSNQDQGQGPLDDLQENEKDPSKQSEIQEEIKVKITQAINVAKMQGQLSPGLERILQDSLKPSKNWKSILRNFLNQRHQEFYSYAKPKRRFMSEDLYLASLSGEKLGSICIAVDCSGSVNEKLLKEFETEIKSIREEGLPAEINLIYFDSRVLKTELIASEDDFKLTPIGGGGTAFSPIFEHIQEKNLNPICTIILTDLCCDDFGPCPGYPVLWASTYEEKAPFGEIIKLN